jgi:hypothetical protein
VTWRGTSYYPETWFDWQDGNIYTKNPDKATLWKLYQMAQKLNAQLEGDEGKPGEPLKLRPLLVLKSLLTLPKQENR